MNEVKETKYQHNSASTGKPPLKRPKQRSHAFSSNFSLLPFFLGNETKTSRLTIQMAPIPSENGVEGDDEREEEEDDDEEEEEEEEEAGEEEEEEEEEEEPRLKYQRMGGSIPTLLASDTASCIAVAERMIALGTHGGTVHILDFLGNQVILPLRFFSLPLFLCEKKA